MSAPNKSADTKEVIALLRQAWKHAEAVNQALARARQHVWTNDLLEAFLLQAAGHAQNSKAMIEQAATLLKSL